MNSHLVLQQEQQEQQVEGENTAEVGRTDAAGMTTERENEFTQKLCSVSLDDSGSNLTAG